MSETPFRVGITSDFETMPRACWSWRLPPCSTRFPGIEYELMPDTHGVGAPEVLDRYDAVIALDYRFPAESFVAPRAAGRSGAVGESATIRSTCTPVHKPVSFWRSRGLGRRPVAEGILAMIFAWPRIYARSRPRIGRAAGAANPPAVADLEGKSLATIGLGEHRGEMFRIARRVGFGRLLAYSRSLPATHRRLESS